MTHGASFAVFLSLVGERVGTRFCIAEGGTGWLCLFQTLF